MEWVSLGYFCRFDYFYTQFFHRRKRKRRGRMSGHIDGNHKRVVTISNLYRSFEDGIANTQSGLSGIFYVVHSA